MADHPLSERLEQLNKRKEEALNAGSERARARQHERGKMLARERIDYFLDDGSFHELDMLARGRGDGDRPYTDGVITGGTIDGARSSSSARLHDLRRCPRRGVRRQDPR
jgi:acetyl-CoA carboxylase carboxyltransferase component